MVQSTGMFASLQKVLLDNASQSIPVAEYQQLGPAHVPPPLPEDDAAWKINKQMWCSQELEEMDQEMQMLSWKDGRELGFSPFQSQSPRHTRESMLQK